MSPLQTLRRSTWLSRLTACWFVLAVLGASLAPALAGDGGQVICSVGGPTTVWSDDGSAPSPNPHSLQCVLCALGAGGLPTAAPVPAPVAPLASPVAQGVLHVFASRPALTRAARGPPSLA